MPLRNHTPELKKDLIRVTPGLALLLVLTLASLSTRLGLPARALPRGRTGLALHSELTAWPADAASALPISRFQKPLRLTVDLTGLVDVTALGKYQKSFVGYQDATTGRWVPLPVVEHRPRPVLTVEVDHFSTFGGGADGEVEWGWTLTFNDAQVSAFDGGLSYRYPIQVVPGRAGLTPQLNLSYNSRRMDGVVSWIQPDWVGLGWTVDAVEIVRQGVRRCRSISAICYQNAFTLVMHGTAYDLKPAAPGQTYGRYHTEDEQFLYIQWVNDGSASGGYWIVRARDGTTYKLGTTENARQVFGPHALDSNGDGVADQSGVDGLTAFRWRVQQVTDPHGNRIDYTYAEETKYQQCVADKDPSWGNCTGTLRDDAERAHYLASIAYNHRPDNGQPGVKLVFQRGWRTSDNANRGDDKEVVEPMFGSTVHSYSYDPNGNMVSRDGDSLTYDAENRLVEVNNGAARFVYDGDGNRVKATFGSTTIVYVGDYYEQEGGTVRTYYYAGGERVAMRENGTLYWLLTDHLGSTAITAYSGGGKKGELRYEAWGETRHSWGSTPTTYRFTGQRWDDVVELYLYQNGRAHLNGDQREPKPLAGRYYDPVLGRFIQPDTLVPEPTNPQNLNRYSYVRNNPVRFIDPTGHFSEEEIMRHFGVKNWEEVLALFEKGGLLAGQWGWLEVLRRAEAGDVVRAAVDPWPWQWDAPLAFAGKFLVERGQILLNLIGGGQITATEAGQQAREAGVTRYELSQRRGPVTWIRDIRATQKYYHVKIKDAGELIFGGVDAVKMWGATVGTGILVPFFGATGVVSCQVGGPPGCAASAMLWTTAVPASAASTYFLAEAAREYTRHWLERSLNITP